MCIMPPLTKRHLPNKERIVWQIGVSLLEGTTVFVISPPLHTDLPDIISHFEYTGLPVLGGHTDSGAACLRTACHQRIVL